MSQKVTISEFRPEDIPLSCTWTIIGPPGSGKCLDPHTPVLMFDGSIKIAKHIVPGDLIMGDDSTPRKVRGITQGFDPMYRISQTGGEDYIVNEPHILCLKRIYNPQIRCDLLEKRYKVKWMKNNIKCCHSFWYGSGAQKLKEEKAKLYLESLVEGQDFTQENILEISVKDYLELPISYRQKYKGYSVSVNFSNKNTVPRDMYSLGVLVGSSIQRGNPPEKIPYDAKYLSRQERCIFLTGLLNSVDHSGAFNSHELESIPNKLANDIVFLSRSLGFRVEVTKNTTSSNVHIKNVPFERGLFVQPPKIQNMSDIVIKPLGLGEYCGFEIDGNGRFLLGDFTVTHNTTFIENMCYYHKHRYPVGRAFIGTEGGYKRMSSIFGSLYVSNYYDEDEEKNHILRQRTCEIENGKGYAGNYAINIIDDASDDPKIYKSKVMRGLFKLGSQHWNQLLMVGSQYAIDMPPDVRKSVSYVAIFFEPEEIERKKLYINFGGLAGSYENFCDLMDELTGDYTCIVFKKRTQSHKMEDNIFFFRTRQLGDWKFGCKEYKEWAKQRYDPNYTEKIIM